MGVIGAIRGVRCCGGMRYWNGCGGNSVGYSGSWEVGGDKIK